MKNNSSLHKAKKEKNDEFYTQLIDVEKELKHYTNFFKDKTVLCNCNDDTWSAFYKYFTSNFKELQLKKLIAVAYNKDGNGIKRIFDGKEIISINLNGHGDFRDTECVEMLLEADVVVTNPPFSLFRDFIALMVQYEKKFLVIGNMNAITYKEIFPLIKDGQMWFGCKSFNGGMNFSVPKKFVLENGRFIVNEDETIIKRLGLIVWFTNIDNNKRNTPLDLYKKYTPEEYPHYDNYDAINVDKVADIPMDWDGVMGVPISFLGKYCPEQFEIIWTTDRGGDGKLEDLKNKEWCKPWNSPFFNNKYIYKRIFIRHRNPPRKA